MVIWQEKKMREKSLAKGAKAKHFIIFMNTTDTTVLLILAYYA
jgi:hypothetical protein